MDKQIQPHCEVCKQPFKKKDFCFTDTLFKQILHTDCFYYHEDYIDQIGTYEEIVNIYPHFKSKFIVE